MQVLKLISGQRQTQKCKNFKNWSISSENTRLQSLLSLTLIIPRGGVGCGIHPPCRLLKPRKESLYVIIKICFAVYLRLKPNSSLSVFLFQGPSNTRIQVRTLLTNFFFFLLPYPSPFQKQWIKVHEHGINGFVGMFSTHYKQFQENKLYY